MRLIPTLLLLVAFGAVAASPIEIPGISEARDSATLSAAVRARVDVIHYRQGDEVEQGAVIMELEHRIQSLEVQRRKLLREDRSELRAAGQRESLARKHRDSVVKILKKAAGISREEVDEAELEYQISIEERKRLQMSEKKQALEFKLAEAERERYLLRSPITGIITAIHLSKGERSDLSEPLVDVVDVRHGVFVALVEEVAGRRVSPGQELELRLQAGRDAETLSGRVIFLSPVVDPSSGLMEIKLEFPNPDGRVRPGVAGTLVIP